MKVHKITVYVLDFEQYGIEEYKTMIENKLESSSFGNCATAEIGEWSDDYQANQKDADMEAICNWEAFDNAD